VAHRVDLRIDRHGRYLPKVRWLPDVIEKPKTPFYKIVSSVGSMHGQIRAADYRNAWMGDRILQGGNIIALLIVTLRPDVVPRSCVD
jgi:hypothetical protein